MLNSSCTPAGAAISQDTAEDNQQAKLEEHIMHDSPRGHAEQLSMAQLDAARQTCTLLFREFGAVEPEMLLSRDQLHLLICTVFHRVGVNLEHSFTIDETELALRAFDIRGNAAVAESDFSAWVIRGLQQSHGERQKFASATPLSSKMNRLLNAIAKLVITQGKTGQHPSQLRLNH